LCGANIDDEIGGGDDERIMSGRDDGDSLAGRRHEAGDKPFARGAVEVGGGFIEEEH
jgi:hypothetical protein